MGHQIFKTDWFWNVDDPKTMNQAILWQSRNAMKYSSSNPAMYFRKLLQLVLLTKKPRLVSSRFGPSDGLVSRKRQAKVWIGCVHRQANANKQEDVQPYGSGIDDALLQWLARVVLPRVLRFPPTKEKWKRWKDGGFPPGSPVSTH